MDISGQITRNMLLKTTVYPHPGTDVIRNLGVYNRFQQDAFLPHIGEKYFPDEMESRHYYHPVDRGLETHIAEKLNYLRDLNKKHGAS
jgi:replication-associated recombination protein RarA